MGDLISRSAYRGKLQTALSTLDKEYSKAIMNEDTEMIRAINNQRSAYKVSLMMLDNMLTAYDEEAVVAELEKRKAEADHNFKYYDDKYYLGKIDGLTKAISIVRGKE